MRLHVRSLAAAAAISAIGVAVAVDLIIRGIGKAIDAVDWTFNDDDLDEENAWCGTCKVHRVRREGTRCPVCVDAEILTKVKARAVAR